MFEGECLRGGDGTYYELDYGPCPVSGSTRPVKPTNAPPGTDLRVPEKCANCSNLRFDETYKYRCAHQEEIWGGPLRALDWLGFDILLDDFPDKLVLKFAVLEMLRDGATAEATRSLRESNPELSLADAHRICTTIADRF